MISKMCGRISKRQIGFFLLSLAWRSGMAFTLTSLPQTTRQQHASTALHVSSVPKDDGSGISYGERSRPYRRDVFAYGDWIRHRDNDRFIGNLLDMFSSGVVRQLTNECVLTTSIATFLCLFNALFVTGWDDFSGVHYDALTTGVPLLAMPSVFFTFTSSFLSLLLVFKTNTSYQRWDEGRKNWGAIVNSSRTIMREGAAWVHQADVPFTEKHRLIARLAGAVWAFPRSMTRHLLSAEEDDADYAEDVRANLRSELAEDLVAARHKPTRAIYELACSINEFPLSDWRRVNMDKAATVLCDAMGSNERIFTSPVPRFYTKHLARFLEVWLLVVPFTLYSSFDYTWNHWFTIPATLVVSFFFLGIEELGIQLEEPFSVLPMHKITNGIGLSAEEHVQWFLKDGEKTQ